jgi:spore coat protein JC
MWIYDKKLQYPVKIKNSNPAMARIIMTQLGGPDGESGASMRYLHQRYACPYGEITGVLTDVGTEELGHMEMIATLVYQLTQNLCIEDIKKSGFDAYFVDHTAGIYPVSAGGIPFSVSPTASKGDIITDLHEDLAAEQKARTTYDNILRLADDPDVKDVIRFLREREIVHYQRFGESLRLASERLDSKNFYALNPSFDKNQHRPANRHSRYRQ